MGEVWRGYHAEQGVPVAVKVMNAKVFLKAENIERFRNEVRAVARLDHPGVVWVFDYGEVSADAASASKGRLVEGSPYLAMELAGNGTLASLRRRLPWPELRAVLLELLDALAHAHAAGVIHRDLKPGNVLVCGARDLRPGLKLTDFGIATADVADAPSHTDEVVGTLHYMAPEQIKGAVWAQGPHTDLYALGCMAWRLACQRVPFSGRGGAELLAAQLFQRLPPLLDGVEMPDGFTDWLHTLTAKPPEARFRRAADAAKALLSLGSEKENALTDGVAGMARTMGRGAAALEAQLEPPTESNAPTLIPSDTRHLLFGEDEGERTANITVLGMPTIDGVLTGPVDPESMPDVRPRMPDDWRRAVPTRPSPKLVGAGLGLYGVRTIPMVGREAERDALWRALADVHSRQQARAVVVRGSAGTGKSRLAAWLCGRAHEVGGASVLRARFSENDAPEEPLRRMIQRELRISERPREQRDEADRMTHLEEVQEILEGWLDWWGSDQPDLIDTLLTVLNIRERGAVDAASRHAMLRMSLEQMCRERPVVVWLDDVQWGLDGILFAQSILDSQALRPLPVLLVLTVRDEALAVQEVETQHLSSILNHTDTLTLPLRPLGRVERARLVQELLGLEPSLGAAVEERSGGNPLFAVQLVGDWVSRGVLVPGDHGFSLAQGQSLHIPEDLTAVWSERIQRLLDVLPRSARWMLERAAVLGIDVDAEEWAVVCDDPSGRQGDAFVPNEKHAAIRRALLDRLLASRLAEATETGWVFGHGLLQETVRTRARQAGRWREHHRAAARMLAHDPRDETAERLGRHLLEAFEIDNAIAPLLRGIRHRRLSIGARSALNLVRILEIAMRTRVRPEVDTWGELLAEKSATLIQLGQLTEARRVAIELFERAEQHGWEEARSLAAFQLGRVSMERAELGDASRWLKRGAAATDARVRAESFFLRSRIETIKLNHESAAELERHAVRALEGSDDIRSRMLSEIFVAESAWDAEDMQRCGDHAAVALELAREIGDLGTQMRCWNFMAEAARAREDYGRAVQYLTSGIAIAETIGHVRAPVLKCNLALVHLARNAPDAADTELAQAMFQLHQIEQLPLLAAVLVFRLQTAATSGSWSAFDDHATQAERLQFELPMGEPDSARAATTAGQLALAAGHAQRARRAWQLALDHWVKLGKSEEARSVREQLEALRSRG